MCRDAILEKWTNTNAHLKLFICSVYSSFFGKRKQTKMSNHVNCTFWSHGLLSQTFPPTRQWHQVPTEKLMYRKVSKRKQPSAGTRCHIFCLTFADLFLFLQNKDQTNFKIKKEIYTLNFGPKFETKTESKQKNVMPWCHVQQVFWLSDLHLLQIIKPNHSAMGNNGSVILIFKFACRSKTYFSLNCILWQLIWDSFPLI